MTLDLFIALVGFAFATSITPGPSNLILLASGANHGFRRSLPLMLGISSGFLTMVLLVGLGIGQVLQTNPTLYAILQFLSVLYVLWLAWKIASSRATPTSDGGAAARPFTFLQAALLQWVNPKAWTVALIVTVSYSDPAAPLRSLLLMILVFGIVNLPSIGTWAVFGTALGRVLRDPVNLRAFNIAMALLLVASMVPILLGLAT